MEVSNLEQVVQLGSSFKEAFISKLSQVYPELTFTLWISHMALAVRLSQFSQLFPRRMDMVYFFLIHLKLLACPDRTNINRAVLRLLFLD